MEHETTEEFNRNSAFQVNNIRNGYELCICIEKRILVGLFEMPA